MYRAVAWAVVLAACVVGFWLGGDGLRLAAIPAGLAALWHLCAWSVNHPVIRKLSGSAWLKAAASWSPLQDLVSLAPALAVMLALYGRLLAGDFPINHDHPVFLFRAYNTWKMLGNGSWFGYSPLMFIGYPANQLYPIGADLLVCAVRAATLGLLSWPAAYSVALFVFILVRTLAFWAFGRKVAGRTAGAVAAVLSLLDRGAWMQGGWSFDLDWGVWSMGLSFALLMWALLAIGKALRDGGAWIPSAAVLLAASVLCHPMAVALSGVLVPIFLISEHLAGRLGHPRRWIPRLATTAIVAGGLCAFWLLPFVTHREWFEPLAARWLTYAQMLEGAWTAGLLKDLGPLLFAWGLLGLLWAAVDNRPLGIFLALAVALCLFLASEQFLLAFDVLLKFPFVANLQLERFAYPARAALLVGCAASLALVFRRVDWKRLLRRPRAVTAVVLGTVIAPVAMYAPRIASIPFVVPNRPLDWSSGNSRWKDIESAAEYLKSGAAGRVGRVLVDSSKHDHLLLALPALAGVPVLKVGFTPENNYRYKFSSRDPRVWKAAGVTHVLSTTRMQTKGLKPLSRFGRLWLYSFGEAGPPAWLEGPGQVEVIRDEPERLVLKLTGTSASSRLVVRRARYGLWRAEIDGTPVEIEGASVGDSPPVFSSVRAEDGVVEMVFRAGAWEWAGGLTSVIALIVLAVLFVASKSKRAGDFLRLRLGRAASVAGDAVTIAAAAAALIGGVLLAARLLLPVHPVLKGRRAVYDFSKHLEGAKALLRRPGRDQPCAPFDGLRIKCPGPEWNHAARTIIGADHLLRSCIWLHPVQGAEFLLEFPQVELADYLEGHMGMDDAAVDPPGGAPVQFTVYIDGKKAGEFTSEPRRGWFHWQVDTRNMKGKKARVGFSSRASFTGRRHFCFTAYTTRAEEGG